MNKPKDAALAKLMDELPSLSLKTLLKPSTEELRALHKALKAQVTPLPLLSFKKADSFHTNTARNALAQVRQKMTGLEADQILLRLYLEKLSEYEDRLNLIEAVQKKDSVAVANISKKLYGNVTITTKAYRDLLTSRIKKIQVTGDKKKKPDIDAEKFALLARQRLNAIGGNDWIIKVMKRDRIQISYKRNSPPTLRIPSTLQLTQKRAEQIICHEIDGHAMRTINGQNSDYTILGRGLAYYQRTEEGIATHLQKTINSGFWDGYTAALRQEKNLHDAYSILLQEKMRYYESVGKRDIEQMARASTWRLIKRTLRGVSNPSAANAAFFRSHIYFEGKKEVREALEKKDVTLNDLMIGNIGLQHVRDVKKLLTAK